MMKVNCCGYTEFFIGTPTLVPTLMNSNEEGLEYASLFLEYIWEEYLDFQQPMPNVHS